MTPKQSRYTWSNLTGIATLTTFARNDELIMINLLFQNPLVFAIYVFALLIAISIHEFSHAWMADHAGDPTPRLQGRLTLNPIKHLDPYGLMFLLFFGFGWGKPVTFDPFNLKDPRRDAAKISLAGPVSNFILAILLSIVLKLFIFFKLGILANIGYLILVPIIQLNIILGVFNLLPIHPLDGFKIVGGLLTSNQSREWYSLERYGLIFLLILIIPLGNQSLLSLIIQPVVSFINTLLLPKMMGGII